MTPRIVLLAWAAALLAGCTIGAEEAATPPVAGSCPDVAEVSASAPLLATLQEDPEQVARRLADALGGNVSGPPDALPSGELRWRDGNVTLVVLRGEDEVHASWSRAEAWRPDRAEAEATLRRALDAFEPPDPDAFEVAPLDAPGPLSLQAQQAYEGRPIVGSTILLTSGANASVVVSSLREVRPGPQLMPEARAVELATKAARCAIDQRGETEAAGHALEGADGPQLGAKGASLAWVVDVRFAEPDAPSPCGHVERVHVDAVTGKVLGIATLACGVE